MSLINIGTIDDFSVQAKSNVLKNKAFLKKINTFSSFGQIAKEFSLDSFEYTKSAEARGLTLKNITLTEGFEGFLQDIFDKNNEIFFLAWAWDLSGEKAHYYPGENAKAEDLIISMKVGNIREFIGEGVNLFPKREVTAGIEIRIFIWESDQKTRDFGETLSSVADAIKNSELNQLLSLVSAATGVTGATVNLVKDAAIELAKVIGIILKANKNDYVDFFTGYYPADTSWATTSETYEGNSSIITLNKY